MSYYEMRKYRQVRRTQRDSAMSNTISTSHIHVSKSYLRLTFYVLLILTLLSPHPQPLAYGIPDRRFGVVESYAAPNAASALGAGWTRVTFEWNQIQPHNPNEWIEYPVSDAHHRRRTCRRTRGHRPDRRYTGMGRRWRKAASASLRVSICPTTIPKTCGPTFIRKLMTRHAGRIQHWIIWNEPDIWDTNFQSWGGSVEDFVQLMKVTYDVAHQIDPNMVIHLPAVTHWWDANYGRDLFLHRYFQILTADPTCRRAQLLLRRDHTPHLLQPRHRLPTQPLLPGFAGTIRHLQTAVDRRDQRRPLRTIPRGPCRTRSSTSPQEDQG